MKFVFGPVFSRRLGRSLGIDVVPFKFCTQDCIYCQLGRTTNKTIERDIYQPAEVILQEISQKLYTKPDFITIGGSGEPTLCRNLEEIIRGIKSISNIPVAILTNGTLLHLQDVRNALSEIDVVCPSLDAGNEVTFQKINRPVESISFKIFLDGLIKFREEYNGKIWLEVMLLKGINDSPNELKQIAECASLVSPDKIHLNTVTRPPAENDVKGLSIEEMKEISKIFNPPAEIIAEIKVTQSDIERKDKNFTEPIEEQILEIIQRHPGTPIELSAMLEYSLETIIKSLEKLLKDGKIVKFTVQNKEIYRLQNPYDK